jgi:hypothetical protein
LWLSTRWLGVSLPNLDPAKDPSVPSSLNGALAASGLMH